MNIVVPGGGGRDAHRTAGGDAGATGTALDLYAGVGLFSSVLNREFERVIAVESSPTSHADLLYNSPANVKAVRATTEQYLENAAGKLRPELVVVDPPRSGLGERVIQGTGEVESSSHHLCFVRSRNSLARPGSPASIRIPGGGGASRGFISPDLPPGKRLPPRPLAQATWRQALGVQSSDDSSAINRVELRSTEQPRAAVPTWPLVTPQSSSHPALSSRRTAAHALGCTGLCWRDCYWRSCLAAATLVGGGMDRLCTCRARTCFGAAADRPSSWD